MSTNLVCQAHHTRSASAGLPGDALLPRLGQSGYSGECLRCVAERQAQQRQAQCGSLFHRRDIPCRLAQRP